MTLEQPSGHWGRRLAAAFVIVLAACGTAATPNADRPATVDPTSRATRWTVNQIEELLDLSERHANGEWTWPDGGPDCPIQHVYDRRTAGTLYEARGQRLAATPDQSAGVVFDEDVSPRCVDMATEALSALTE